MQARWLRSLPLLPHPPSPYTPFTAYTCTTCSPYTTTTTSCQRAYHASPYLCEAPKPKQQPQQQINLIKNPPPTAYNKPTAPPTPNKAVKPSSSPPKVPTPSPSSPPPSNKIKISTPTTTANTSPPPTPEVLATPSSSTAPSTFTTSTAPTPSSSATSIPTPSQEFEYILPDPSKFTVERKLVHHHKDPSINVNENNSPKGPRFTILQYNVLITQIDVVPQYYYCPEYAQKWEYRGPNLVREMLSYAPDIICLQEVDKFDFFDSNFAQHNYTGIYEPRPYKHLDGLALFFKKDKFKLIKKHIINYNKIHMPTKDPYAYYLENRFGHINRGKSKYETNNIALVCEFETIGSDPRRLFVATTHIYWNPKMPELKVLQSYTLLKELERILNIEKGKSIPPLVITGDFNAMPSSGMYQLYTSCKLPSTHADIQALVLKDLVHSIPIRSAYQGLDEPLTNITKGFVGTLDYIWYGNTKLALNRVLSPITNIIDTHGGMPNLEFSSDHTALMCELDFIS